MSIQQNSVAFTPFDKHSTRDFFYQTKSVENKLISGKHFSFSFVANLDIFNI